jgi:streptogramin lyase
MNIRMLVVLHFTLALTGCAHVDTSPTSNSVGEHLGQIVPLVHQTGQHYGWQVYPIPSQVINLSGSSANTMVAGHDGAVWAVINGGAMRIDMNGTVSTYAFGSSGYHGPISANPDGNIYAAEQNGGFFIARITPDGKITELPIPGPAGPVAMISGSDGNLWMTRQFPTSVGRLTPSGVYTDFAEGIFGQVVGIVRGADKNLWMIGTASSKVVLVRVSVVDGSVKTFTLPARACFNCFAADSDGGIWIPDGRGIYHFDPLSQRGQTNHFPYNAPTQIIGGPNRLLYYVVGYPDVYVCEYDIDRNIRVRCVQHPAPQAGVDGWTVGPDYQLWVAHDLNIYVKILHLLVTDPATISVSAGASTNLAVSERKWFQKQFTAVSNDPNIATVGGGPISFSITGVNPGSTTVTVADTVGNTLDVPVTVH